MDLSASFFSPLAVFRPFPAVRLHRSFRGGWIIPIPIRNSLPLRPLACHQNFWQQECNTLPSLSSPPLKVLFLSHLQFPQPAFSSWCVGPRGRLGLRENGLVIPFRRFSCSSLFVSPALAFFFLVTGEDSVKQARRVSMDCSFFSWTPPFLNFPDSFSKPRSILRAQLFMLKRDFYACFVFTGGVFQPLSLLIPKVLSCTPDAKTKAPSLDV